MIKRDLYYDRIPTKSLRDDVRLLGTILGKVIKTQEGENFYKLVEKIRLLSKSNILGKNKKDPFKKISLEINKQSPEKIFKLTRAFGHFMNFVNLAESIDASRTLDEFENTKSNKINKNIFIEEIFENLFKKKSISSNKIYNYAKNMHIGIVLTAHPTEVKRRTLIQKYHKLTEILEHRDLLKNYPSKLKILDKQLHDEISIIWNTDELKRTKPTPSEEARWGLAIIEDSLWETIPKVYRRLNGIFVKNMGKGLPKNFNQYFLTGKNAEQNAKIARSLTGLADDTTFQKLSESVGGVGDVLRVGKTGFDLGFMLLQGLPMLGRAVTNPSLYKAWGDATINGFKALFSEQSLQTFVREMGEKTVVGADGQVRSLLDDYVLNGGNLSKYATDLYAGVPKVQQVLGKGGRVGAGVGKVLDSFERSFIHSGDVLKIRGYEILRPSILKNAPPGTEAEALKGLTSFGNKSEYKVNNIIGTDPI